MKGIPFWNCGYPKPSVLAPRHVQQVFYGDADTVSSLLEASADVDEQLRIPMSALAVKGHLDWTRAFDSFCLDDGLNLAILGDKETRVVSPCYLSCFTMLPELFHHVSTYSRDIWGSPVHKPRLTNVGIIDLGEVSSCEVTENTGKGN